MLSLFVFDLCARLCRSAQITKACRCGTLLQFWTFLNDLLSLYSNTLAKAEGHRERHSIAVPVLGFDLFCSVGQHFKKVQSFVYKPISNNIQETRIVYLVFIFFMLSRAAQRVSFPICFMRRAFFVFARGACLFRHTCAAAAPRSGVAVSPKQDAQGDEQHRSPAQQQRFFPPRKTTETTWWKESRKKREGESFRFRGHLEASFRGTSDLIGEKHHPRDEQLGAVGHLPGQVPPAILGKATPCHPCFQEGLHPEYVRFAWTESPSGTSPTTRRTHSICRPSPRLRCWMATCGKVFLLSALLFETALLQYQCLKNVESEATGPGMDTGVNREGPARPAVGTTLLVTGTTLQPQAESQRFLASTATTSARPPQTLPSWGPKDEPVSWTEEDHRRRMFATDEIGRLRLLSMRKVMALSWALLDENSINTNTHNHTNNTTNSSSTSPSDGNNTSMTMGFGLGMGEHDQHEQGEREGDQDQGQEEERMTCMYDLEELSFLEEVCILDMLFDGYDGYGLPTSQDGHGLPSSHEDRHNGLPSSGSGAARLLRPAKDEGSDAEPQPHFFLRPRPGERRGRTDGGNSDEMKEDSIEVEALASSLAELELQPGPQQQEDTAVPGLSFPAGEIDPFETETKFAGRRLDHCSVEKLLELSSHRCEVHRSAAQRLKWSRSGSLREISEDVARDLHTWSIRHCQNLSVAGSSRRLGLPQQRYSETIASIYELDQLLAKLRLVPLQVMGGDQGLAVVAADSLPLFWTKLPFLVRCALLQATTVCGVCSLLYLLNLHKLTASVFRSLRGSSSSSCATASRKDSQAELRDEDQVSELPGHGRGQEVEEQPELDDEQHRGAAGFVQEVEEANIGPDALSYFFEVGEEGEAADAEVAQPSLLAGTMLMQRGTVDEQGGFPPPPRSPPPTRQAEAASSSSGPSALSSEEAAAAQEADALSRGSSRGSSNESGARAGDAADGGSCSRPSSGTSSALLRQIPTSTSECGRNGYQGAESRSLFQGEWQLHRLENFAEEYYPARNPKMHGLRRHMSGFQIFGDIMEDLWGGEPLELSFMHLRKLEGMLLHMDRIARLLAAAEDAASDRVLLPPWSAVEFDEVARSCGGSSWAASELLSERDEVCSSTTSAVCAAERSRQAEEAPPSRASSPNSERDLEMQSRDGDEWLAARDDHLHDQRRKLKKEMVEPLVAFIPASEGAKFLRGLETTKAIYLMHLEKRSSIGLDGCSGRSKGASATAAGEGAQEDESCTPKDDELELVATRLSPGFGTAEVIEALTHAAGRAGGAAAAVDGSRVPGSERREGVRPASTLPREVYRRTKGGGRFVPLLQRRKCVEGK